MAWHGSKRGPSGVAMACFASCPVQDRLRIAQSKSRCVASLKLLEPPFLLGPTTVSAHSMRAIARAIPLMGWLLFAGIVHAAPMLDQQHTPSGNFPAFAVANDRTQIQTFTVGITGALTAIDVQVSREPLTVENLVLSLWSTDAAGLPQARLATKSVAATDPAFTSTGPRPFIAFDLAGGAVEVTAGELLAIELNSTAANSPPFFNAKY